ncbi:phenylalanine--tRNA ligase subunit alpha [Candidatus Uhrbacteria bacterium]|nr:phenylalanine--tRNA ligase subunit alpha [Candidatus Uhrbacteria bacterium]
MEEQLKRLAVEAKEKLAKLSNSKDLEDLEISILGRKAGQLTNLLKTLKDLSDEEKRRVGPLAQATRAELESLFAQRRGQLEGQAMASDRVDLSLPGTRPPQGHLHLTTQAIFEIEDIFKRIGFVRVRYPEVEWDYYAFGALNMPSDHPARDDWETFFITPPHSDAAQKMLLTPHTSSGQVREMEKGQLPIRMINISKCYRRQSDISHVPMFHQFEGLYIDEQVNICHLKGVLDYFARTFFGRERKTRIRPFHFQFTEPSFEVDINCAVCLGKGCRLCKEGWLELGGSGMVHPNVLKAGGLDPAKVSGFAFGWGVERVMMMKSGLQIDDIRLLYQNDLRFLEQF